MTRPGLGGRVRRGGQARGEGPAGSLCVCVHTTGHARREDGDCAALVGQLHVGEDPHTGIVVQDHRLFGIAEHAGVVQSFAEATLGLDVVLVGRLKRRRVRGALLEGHREVVLLDGRCATASEVLGCLRAIEHAGKDRFGLRAAHKVMERGHPVGHRIQGECQPNRSGKK